MLQRAARRATRDREKEGKGGELRTHPDARPTRPRDNQTTAEARGTGGKTARTLEGSEESPDWGGRRPWIVAVPGPVGPGRRIDL